MAADHSDPVVAEYARLAADYDRRWARYIGASVAATLRRLAVRPADRVLDVGCGTGELLAALAAITPARLAGIDPSPDMLDRARRKLPAAADLVRGSAEAMPLPSDWFDVVTSTSAFHYFREPARALAEIRRVLKPGGRLVITDWCDDFLACKVCDRLLRLVNRAHFRAYGSAECAALLRQAGFADVTVERYRIGWPWGLMTAQATNPR